MEAAHCDNQGRTLGAITERRLHLGLTVAQVARKAGVNVGTLYKIEARTRVPQIGTLHAISQVLEIPLQDLIAEYRQ